MSDDIRRHFHRQGDACERLGSPFTARVCRLLADNLDGATRTGRAVLGWRGSTGDDALALRMCGGLHRLVIEDRDVGLASAYPPNEADDAHLASALLSAISSNDAFLEESLSSPPQTNEIARAAMLLPGFLLVAREVGLPLKVLEIGSSAGLLLNFDRFGYRYGAARWGDANSPVQLAPEVRGRPVELDGDLRVAARTGSDIAPVDVSSPLARNRLKSYVWPDQAKRVERLSAAIALAELHPYRLLEADAAEAVATGLKGHTEGEALVLFHSIMWQYLSEKTRSGVEALMSEAGLQATETRPLAWLRMEPIDLRDGYATLQLTLWPGGETRHLARCDYHGRYIEWLEPG